MTMTSHTSENTLSLDWVLLFLVWLTAVVSMLGSLFFSEVMGVVPCVLCWYQRIAMYPLVFILPLGLFPLDVRVARYVLPLPVLGGVIALYHVALVAGFVPENMQPCTQGVPCKETSVELFGFLTIPLMSLFSFLLIVGLLVQAQRRGFK